MGGLEGGGELFEAGEFGFELDLGVALLLDDVGRSAGDEALVGELGLHAREELAVLGDFTVDALRDGIRRVIAGRYDRAAIRRDVLARFSSEVIARQYLELYESMLGGNAD